MTAHIINKFLLPPPPPDVELPAIISPSNTQSDEVSSSIDKINIYSCSVMNKEKKWERITYVPPKLAIECMNKTRKFIENNNIPFEVCCISGRRICIRNNDDFDNVSKSKRILYKAIFKTTDMCRCNNPYWCPNALVWDAWDEDDTIELLNFDFDKDMIKQHYLEYKAKDTEIDDWCDNWIVS